MSSVAVLTQESFAEHRSGLVPQQIKGEAPPHSAGNRGASAEVFCALCCGQAWAQQCCGLFALPLSAE